MNEVIAYFTEVSTKLPGYARYIHIVVIALIIVLTEVVKLPLRKYVIDVKITDVNVRKKVNLVFMVLPFAFGLSASAILMCFGYKFSWEAGISWGVYAQVAYELAARIILKIKNNEPITDETIKEDFEEVKAKAEKTAEKLNKKVNADAEKKVKQTAKEFDEFIKQIKGE